ncbi:nucleotidyltransferase domain-containing protein [Candidatus Bathyarchaeota archaeon]|nr:nucleotidyltransferase domain-containing protein [Candidatus Bathyarchaeota archaeon]
MDALKVFLENLLKEIGDAEVYIFGSYARGDWVEDSDIDLVVISSRFRGVNMCDRMSMLRKLAPDTYAFEILAYTPEEFEVIKHSVVIGDAMEYWIKLL